VNFWGGLAVAVGIVALVLSVLPDAVDQDAAMREPVVQPLTVAVIGHVELKPRYRGALLWNGSARDQTRLVEVKAGQSQIEFGPTAQELFVPDVWKVNDWYYCLEPTYGMFAIKGVPEDFGATGRCDDWAVTAAGSEADVLRDVAAVWGGYVLDIEPPQSDSVMAVTYQAHERRSEPFYYDLAKLVRGRDENKVTETYRTVGATGTGFLLGNHDTQNRWKVTRSASGIRWVKESDYYAEGEQSLILTNAHVVGAHLDGSVYTQRAEDGQAIVAVEQVVASEVLVRLNPSGAWLPAEVHAADSDKDLAMLALKQPLPDAPSVDWLPARDALEPGRAVWVAGFPMGLSNEIVTRGKVGAINHIPAAGVPLWGRNRVLANVDAMAGNSGSPVYARSGGRQVVAGVLHASYGTPLSTEGLPAGEPVNREGWRGILPWGLSETLPAPSEIIQEAERHAFVEANYKILITRDDVAAFVFEQGFSIPGLIRQFDWVGE